MVIFKMLYLLLIGCVGVVLCGIFSIFEIIKIITKKNGAKKIIV